MATSAKTGANAVVFVGAVIAAVIFGNIVANRFFKRVDLSLPVEFIHCADLSAKRRCKKYKSRIVPSAECRVWA